MYSKRERVAKMEKEIQQNQTQEVKLGKKILDYFVKTLNGMALGLFSTLIIGVIIQQIGNLFDIEGLVTLSVSLRGFMGIGIGLGVAWSLGLSGLSLIAGAVAGGVATSVQNDPMVAYITTIAAIEILRFILRRKTPVDIIIIPFFSSILAFAVASLIGSPVAYGMSQIGAFINMATEFTPFFMGIVIAVVMGMALTAPISSAAIAISIGISNPEYVTFAIAGGAAVVGGATQMIGFAVMSRKDNSIGTVLAVAFGTSMLQFKNILRKPIIWVPTIITSAILGPISTMLFQIETNTVGAGMGTSGLVGQIGTLDIMGYELSTILIVILMHFILPALLVFGIDVFFRHKKWILPGDLKI